MATDHNFKVKNGLHVEGANTKIVDAGSGNVKLDAGGTLSIRPEGTTSNKHFFELNDYTAAGTIQGANLTATGTTTTQALTLSNGGDRSITGPLNQSLIINARPNDTTEGLKLQISGTDRIFIKQDGNVTLANNLTIGGSLTVNGSTTTIDTATLQVEDKNITINYSSGDSSSTADGAGITIQDAVNSSTDATILWDATNDGWIASPWTGCLQPSHLRAHISNSTVYGTSWLIWDKYWSRKHGLFLFNSNVDSSSTHSAIGEKLLERVQGCQRSHILP